LPVERGDGAGTTALTDRLASCHGLAFGLPAPGQKVEFGTAMTLFDPQDASGASGQQVGIDRAQLAPLTIDVPDRQL